MLASLLTAVDLLRDVVDAVLQLVAFRMSVGLEAGQLDGPLEAPVASVVLVGAGTHLVQVAELK